MEPEPRRPGGFRARVKNFVRSHSRGKKAASTSTPAHAQSALVNTPKTAPASDAGAVGPLTPGPKSLPTIVTSTTPRTPPAAPPVVEVSQAELQIDNLSLEEERTTIWETAYKQLQLEEPELVSCYEIVLEGVSSRPPGSDESSADAPFTEPQGDQRSPPPKQLTLNEVSQIQLERLKNRQWTWALFGSKTTIRDTIDSIFKLSVDSSALISIGMSFAPPYVSLPWSAISALIPLIMNNSAEQGDAISGLYYITQILFSYRIAEEVFLVDSRLQPIFCKAVLPLYKQLLHYQAAAAIYFGKNTLSRMGRDMLAGKHWSSELASVRIEEENSRTSVQFLSSKQGLNAHSDLKEILNKQTAMIQSLPLQLSRQQAETTQVLQWASQIPFYSDHSHVKSKMGSVREQWLLKDPEYRTWRASQSGILYLEATVGKGKSSLVSGLVDDMLLKVDSRVVFFYCSNTSSPGIGQAETTSRAVAINLVRSFMRQVALSGDRLCVSPALLSQFETSYDKIPGGCAMNLEECVEVIRLVIQEDQRTQWTFFVDALDECKDPAILIQALKTLPGMSARIRVVVSSREGNLVEFKKSFPTTKVIKITNQNFADIKTYVEKEVRQRGSSFGFSDVQQTRLIELLYSRAQGMFLWVVLQIEIMLPKGTLPRPSLEPEIDAELLKLEESQLSSQSQLDDTYQQIFGIATRGQSTGLHYAVIVSALQLSVCSFRALTARELAYMSSIRADGSFTKGVTESFIMINCANLLTDSKNVGVRLAHLSVGEFLDRSMPGTFSLPNAHASAAFCCLAFRSSPAAHELPSDAKLLQDTGAQTPHAASSEDKLPTTTAEFWTELKWIKLRSYVSWYWPVHCRHARVTQRLLDMIPEHDTMELYDAVRVRNHAALRAIIAKGTDVGSASELSSIEQSELAQTPVALQISLESRPQKPRTALHEAVRLQDSDAVDILILAGADVNRKDIYGCTPLHTSAFLSDASTIASLIRAGANKNAGDSVGATPLHYAVYHNHENSVRVLLALGVQRDSLDLRMNTALHSAVYLGFVSITQILIESGCSIDARNVDGNTPSQILLGSNSVSLRDIPAVAAANSDSAGGLRWSTTDLGSLIVAFGHNAHASRTGTESGHFTVKSRHLCVYCNVSSWLNNPRDGIKHAHQPSLTSLSSSAENGCEICTLFVKGLSSQEKPSLQASDETQVWVELSRMWSFDVVARHILTVSVGVIASYQIEMCSNGSPAFKHISGRSIDPFSGSANTFSKLTEWMDGCERDHPLCRLHEANPELPKRLVDISEEANPGRIRLVKGSDLKPARNANSSTTGPHAYDYAFLSHRYGEKIIFDMTKEMWGNPDRTFPIQKLLQSFQDGIKWIHQLGIRYLWVDKLCIDWVAGDGDIDSVGETAKLAEYCKRAALVINAGDHEDANGIFTRRETNLLELTCEFHDGKTAVLCFRTPLPSAEQCFSDQILSRSWIFQEIALPRRVIIFGKDQVYWKCRQAVHSEGDVLVSRPPLDFSAVPSVLDPSADGQKLFGKWYKMVSLFSSKKISFFNDRLPAIKGMAIVHESNMRSQGLLAGHGMPYHSGLWEPDLHRGLLWYAADVRNARRPQTNVPSWSWASIEGTISYSFLPGLLAPSGAGSATEITVRDVRSMIDSLEPAFGPPCGRPNAFIPALVNAPWAYIDPTSQDGSCQILFDTGDDEDRWYEGGSGYDFAVVVIAKWSPERSETSFRWIGLLLEIVDSFGSAMEQPCLESFRVGLVLGPWSDVGVETWSRGDFVLANGWFDHAENVIEVDEDRDVDHTAMMNT